MDRWTVEATASDDGTLWRAEQSAPDGTLLDATRWTRHPAQAIRDLRLLRDGVYWCSEARRPYSHAA